MNHISFGSVLKEARISKGYDLTTVSRRLRIRPDILEAIENSDFERMPPRGYSRNMINAYARFLGLNANDVTRMYLDESYANQIGRAHQNAIENRYMHRNTSQATSRPGKRQPTNQFKAVSSTRQRIDDGTTRQNGRRIYSDTPDDVSRASAARARAAARLNRNDDPQLHPARREAIPDGKYVNLYANPSRGMGHAPRNMVPIIIGAVVVIILLIAIIASVASCSGNDQDVQNIPVTGIENQEGEGNGEENQPAAVAPTDFTLTYEVVEGKTAYIEVIVDGKTKEADDVTGPSTQTYTSSGTIKFVTSNPSNVVVKVDGQDQTLEENSRGVASVTFSFDEILNKWYADHPEVQRPASSTGSSTGTTSGSSTGSSTTPTSTSNNSSSNSNSSSSNSGSSNSSNATRSGD